LFWFWFEYVKLIVIVIVIGSQIVYQLLDVPQMWVRIKK